MKKIELFEQALCCDTGVCGPSVNRDLMITTAAFNTLVKDTDRFDAYRYNLNSTPEAFAKNPDILGLIEKHGNAVLPILRIDNEIKKTGSYPTLDELSEYSGAYFVEQPATQCCNNNSKNCC